ncbi:MAG: TolC family protein, partial [Thiobacillus sp.]
MMNTLRTLSVVLAATLTGACTMIPEYQRPAAPVPATFPYAAPTESPAALPPADAIAWRDYFADARLREVIALALVNNRDLRVAALNIEKARAQYRILRADLFPAIGATASQTVQRLPGELTRSGEAETSRQY